VWEDEKPRRGMTEKGSTPKEHTSGSSIKEFSELNMTTQPQT